MPIVSLVQMGQDDEVGELLPQLARELNARQYYFRFIAADTIPNIGPPTRLFRFYEFQSLFAILRQSSAADIVVGVTHESITNTEIDTVAQEMEYFSLSDVSHCAVVTTSMEKWSLPTRTRGQYLGFLIFPELLNILAGIDLMHSETRTCIFDDCEDRSLFKKAMAGGRICKQCYDRLTELRVDIRALTATTEILRWCKRRTWAKSVEAVLINPVSTLILGIAGGWVTSVFLGQSYWPWVLSATVTAIGVVVMYARLRT